MLEKGRGGEGEDEMSLVVSFYMEWAMRACPRSGGDTDAVPSDRRRINAREWCDTKDGRSEVARGCGGSTDYWTVIDCSLRVLFGQRVA